ncbi:hypothetical protein Peur_074317 [Populus x canadensis]
MEREKRNTNIKYIKYNKPGWDKETGANYIWSQSSCLSQILNSEAVSKRCNLKDKHHRKHSSSRPTWKFVSRTLNTLAKTRNYTIIG